MQLKGRLSCSCPGGCPLTGRGFGLASTAAELPSSPGALLGRSRALLASPSLGFCSLSFGE